MTFLLGIGSGVLVGFLLGLVGGGGSILAVPLLAHVVGVASPHVALGTSAVAVAVNAILQLVIQARSQSVKWRCAALFSASGILGALSGSLLGQALNGERLLLLFGLFMIGVGLLLFLPRQGEGHPEVRLTRASARTLSPRLIALGFLTGLASGFFGIGGGFLIVPALILATDMPLPMAVSSSLIAVTAFSTTTALSYASTGQVDFPIAAVFIAGGVLGGLWGRKSSTKLAQHGRALSLTFAALVVLVGVYVTARAAL